MNLIADRLNRISPSQTIAISSKARALKAAGRDIISLSAGEPDFDTPEHIKQAAIAAIQSGDTKYTDVAGTRRCARPSPRNSSAIAASTTSPRRSSSPPAASRSFSTPCSATVQAGDEVVIPTPCWVSYPDIVGAGRRQAGFRALQPE